MFRQAEGILFNHSNKRYIFSSAVISSSIVRNFSDFLWGNFGNLRLRSWAMTVIHYCNACYSWCVCRLKCCYCIQWNDQNLLTVLFAKKFSYGTNGSKQDNTLSQRRCSHDNHPNQIPCVEETMRITELQQFILKSYIQNSAVLPEWVGDWKKGKLYCRIHTYIHSMDP